MGYLLRYSHFQKERLIFRFSFCIAFLMCIVSVHSQSSSEESLFRVRGKVLTEKGTAVSNADIYIKNTFIGTVSNDIGNFEIPAKVGDTLVISAFLMNTEEKEIGTEDILNIKMEPNAELLEDIFLKQKNEREESISTAFQTVKRRALAYPTGTIRNSEFWPGDISIYESINRFPFIQGNQGGPLQFQRSRGQINPTPALVILDDVPVDQSILRQLDPDQIHSVSMVRSLAGTVKYGSLGAGGVIYIKTKLAANFDEPEGILPRASLVRNNYTDEPLSIEEGIKESVYIGKLQNARSFEEAKSIYDRQTLNLGISSMAYYLEAADYFTKWDQLYSHEVLSRLFRLSNNNPKVLLAIAYQCEQLNRLHQAAYVYQELMLMRPNHLQSYIDLAQIYTQTGNYKLANTLYKQMLFNNVANMDFSSVESLVINEYRRFLSKYRAKVNFKGLPSEMLIPNSKRTARIVLEWTNPLSEFEIQFVSPDKKYFNWRHTAFDNKGAIENELDMGFAIKDFVIEDAENGEWIININRLGNDSDNVPTFVKYTMYKNYGLPNETVEMKMVPLNKVDEKVTLDAFLD